ncbi:hypothetical protein ACIGNX_00790 [Actinosynnema sp. NPDC053489]|uniref:hypothetical protein n=1 Tax=Actinosynnema sp. NPDC053489 TaxID=3363916 RepID=UPI0037C5B93A
MPELFGGSTEGGAAAGGYSGYYVPVHTWTTTPGAQQVSVDDLFAALDTLDDVFSLKPEQSALDGMSHP